MPEVVRAGKYVVVIFVADHPPAHVHVKFSGCQVRVLIADSGVTLDETDGKPKSKTCAGRLKL